MELDKFPETMAIALAVTAMGVSSPDGVFVRTGAEARPEDGDDGHALSVKFVHAPQDGSADADISVRLQPSFVHYSAATVARVTNFFKTPEVGGACFAEPRKALHCRPTGDHRTGRCPVALRFVPRRGLPPA